MPQPSKIPLAFAASGDKNTIPENTETTGLASWRDGFPAITSTPFAEGGIAPKRADFNGIFYALSQAVMWLQQGGVYAYDATTDYEVGNVVEYSGDLYKCITANGPGSAVKDPTDTTVWDAIATASGYLPLSGGTMTGTLVLNSGSNIIRAYDNSHQLSLYGGQSAGSTNGAKIYLNGADYSDSGEFVVQAGNSGGYKQLIGTPLGVLTWDGSQVVTESDLPVTSQVSTEPYTYKLKFPSGAMIQGYFSYSEYTDTNGRITWTFPEAFIQDPFVAISKVDASQSLNIYSTNKSRTIFRVNNMSGTNVGSGVKSGMMGIAIGRWK